MNKPKFNPNQPFDVAKPKFDPSQPFQGQDQDISELESGLRGLAQGASFGFSDEITGAIESALSNKSYEQARNESRAAYKDAEEANPISYNAGNIGGAAATAFIPGLGEMNIAKAAALGGVSGLGASSEDSVGGQLIDTAKGAGIGAAVGKIADIASPYVSKGISKLSSSANDLAESLAFKSSGPTLRDYRSAVDKGIDKKLGRFMLDKGMVKPFDSVDDVARKASGELSSAGSKLDDIYSKASDIFKEKLQTTGFDPLRDKGEIIQAAKKELGDSAGSSEALEKLSKYLDDVAERHGDQPMQEAMFKYKNEVQKYLDKKRQYLKDFKEYKNQVGNAANNDQELIPGFFDDFQRTGTAKRQIELSGKDPGLAYSEPYEPWTQQELISLPTRPQAGFNPTRGDDLLPLQQQMSLDELWKNTFSEDAIQAEILGLHPVQRNYADVNIPTTSSGSGQMQMPFRPDAPARPIRPDDIRNPMSPRRANDIKSALDAEINYSRNPMMKEPAKEKAFSGARNKINEKIMQSLEDLGGGGLASELRAANKDYGLAKTISDISEDRITRESANKAFGLTDSIAASGAGAYGAATGDWATSLGVVGLKKGFEKFGSSSIANAADAVSKALLKSPQMSAVYKSNPMLFQKIASKFESSLFGQPMAAETPDSSVEQRAPTDKNDLIQRTRGSRYSKLLQDAAARGDQSFNAAHFVLSQRDPEYRKQIGATEK